MMISRRDFLQAGVAATAILGVGGTWSRIAARQSMTQADLLDFDAFGNVTLIHLTDLHAQLKPVYFREPDINLGVGAARGQPPHVTGADFLKLYGIGPGSPEAHALTHEDFAALARAYGKMGGMDRVATVVKAIRADRPDALLLDGGDTWHGSYTAEKTRGQDVVTVMNALSPDAMTAHWEFTFGKDRVDEIVDALGFPLLGANIFDNEWDEPAYEPWRMFERGGVRIAVIGQAFPYLPIANPRWMFPTLSFGIREDRMREVVRDARDAGRVAAPMVAARDALVLDTGDLTIEAAVAAAIAAVDAAWRARSEGP